MVEYHYDMVRHHDIIISSLILTKYYDEGALGSPEESGSIARHRKAADRVPS